ncbi:MAG: acyl-CoA/acyl-ACP dehydrogenase [Dehalococcoidales bacterium]|nr:acyl-CoA/acyl-ACP dehydrogenase [Dehalococcoidales bacterium]
MDFALNEQQEMMQTLARDFLAGEYPEKVLRAVAESETGFDPRLWKKLAETNLLGLSIPEEYGGVGDFLDLTVVLEEMGRACFISPFFTAVALGAGTILEAGSAEQKAYSLPAIAGGKSIVTLAVAETSTGHFAEGIRSVATRAGDGFAISGTKLFVPDAQAADHIIWAARAETGITLFILDIKTPGITIRPLKTISGEKQCEVTFENVRVGQDQVLGYIGQGWGYLEKVLERASVATCAEMVGMADHVLRITLDYARERVAFGHPIGAFQAIQHRFADMAVDVDGSRFVTYQAAWRINSGLPAEREVAAARVWVTEACQRVVNSAHQIHGAIGFTEDHVLHFYTKKVRARGLSLGGIGYHLGKLS